MLLQLVKCGYCRRHKVFSVGDIDKNDGLMFCSRWCRNRFMWLVGCVDPFWRLAFKKKFRFEPGPREFRVVKESFDIRLESFNNKIDDRMNILKEV